MYLNKSTTCLVAALLLLALGSASATNKSYCPVGEYYDGSCFSCTSCDPGSRRAPCQEQCFCSLTNNCRPSATASAPVNKISMCESYNERKDAICVLCEENCNGYDYDSITVSEPVVPTSKDCAKSCVCTAHSDCPTNFFCGSAVPSKSVNVCRKCSECSDFFAVDGKCPHTQCASSFQCQTNSDCANVPAIAPHDPSRWCSNNFQCHNCTMNSFLAGSCYTRLSARKSRSAYSPNSGQPASLCSKDCCGWSTFPRYDYLNSEKVYFHYGLCDAEKYQVSGFRAFFIKRSEISTDKYTQLENGEIFGSTPTQAIAAGGHECKVETDTNPPGVYPRKVPFFTCTGLVGNCDKDHVGIVVFASMDNKYQTLNRTYWDVNTNDEGCDLGRVILTIVIILVCVGLAILCAIGAIVYCCCIRPARVRRAAQGEYVTVGGGAVTYEPSSAKTVQTV